MTATAQKPKVPFSPGVIVRCRKRDWVLLPSDGQEIYRLRPLVGTTEDIVGILNRSAPRRQYALTGKHRQD